MKVSIELMPEEGDVVALTTLMQFLLTLPQKWEELMVTIQEVEQKLTDLTAEVGVVKDDLGKAVAAMTDSSGQLATLKQQNADLQAQIVALQAQGTVTPEQLQALSDGLAGMKSGLEAAAAPLEALVNQPVPEIAPAAG